MISRRSLLVALLFVVLIGLPGSNANSQTTNADLLTQAWKASWIRHPDGPTREFGVFHFRKSFTLPSAPRRFVIHVSADNRYELFVNGQRVATGPARGDLNHWRYDTLDIASHLQAGKNVLAAVVWNYAEFAPMAQMMNEAGFVLQGDGDDEAIANSDASWKALKDDAVQTIHYDTKSMRGYFVVGPGERVNGSGYPWGWEKAEYDDSAWVPAGVIGRAAPRGARDSPSRWYLIPRNIPMMEETPEHLARVVRSQGVDAPGDFLGGHAPLTIPANTHAKILFDQSHLTTAYPELSVSGGRGSEVSLTYAEALFIDRHKGNRNETEGREIFGYHDEFLPDGGAHRQFRSLWWRTYRYLQMDVTTQTEPLVVEDLHGAFSAYPFEMRAQFQSDDPELAKMWEVGWRTARLCAHETYMDCPYYEQLQYVGDTRIQALISLYMTGDDRLVKNAIESLDESRTPEGLTQSRYPSWLPQYIPPFSLFWVDMMHDLWWYHGDAQFLRGYLPGARNVLVWFENRLTPSGLLGGMEWWNFVDWSDTFKNGDPPMEQNGQSSILSLQFVAALRAAADLETAFGSAQQAEHDRALASRVAAAVYKTCWDPKRRLIADTPVRQQFSQHANILAILEDAVPPADQAALMKTVLTDPSLTQATYYFRFYLIRAMKKAGFGDQYLDQLGPWRQMLALGLTTWAEKPEPTRSDCHAWSAHPNFDLLATVAGIEPGAAEFRQVEIRPHLGALHELQATLPHPQGEIHVAYQRKGKGLVADVVLPEKLSGWFYWEGKRVALHGGRQHLTF
ncbi:MAG: alpha-L-rhamnosidase N-terminal domain-containing protein [Acidobacteriota bacterium]|nr:alpha-L-rhamnosidase N-terminal domain-containing protein [Acidobacteriota bacterium]